MTVTAVRIGTREECEKAMRMLPTSGAWDDARGAIVHGRLVGKPRYARHEDHWHVEQEIEPT